MFLVSLYLDKQFMNELSLHDTEDVLEVIQTYHQRYQERFDYSIRIGRGDENVCSSHLYR